MPLLTDIATKIKTWANAKFQPLLVSGTNIKTVNSNSLLGTGNIVVGGETANVETLSAHKTLTASDAPIQIYTTASSRYVDLPTTGLTIGQKFEIWNNSITSSTASLFVRVSGVEIDRINVQSRKIIVWDGTTWDYDNRASISQGENSQCSNYGVAVGWKTNGSSQGVAVGANAYGSTSGAAVGYNAKGSTSGAAVGYSANGSTSGAAVGYNANGFTSGAAIGYGANGSNYGVAVGSIANGNASGVAIGYGANGTNTGAALGYASSTNSKSSNAVALGSYAKAERAGEIVSISDDSQKVGLSITKYREKDLNTAAATWQALFIDGASARLTIIASSVYHFRVQINAIDKTNFDVKTWTLEGAIKRNNANATSIVGTVAKVVTSADAGAVNWDVQVTADDTNEALKVEVKHDSANLVRYSLNIWATETRI